MAEWWQNFRERLQAQGGGYDNVQAMRQEEQKTRMLQEAERRDSLIRDAFTVQRQLQDGDLDSARYTLISRLDRLREQGVDSRETFGVLQMLESGDIEGAMREVGTVVDYARQFGETASKDTAAIQNYKFFESVISDPNATPEQKQAAAYQLAAAGRPQGARVIDQNGQLITVAPGAPAAQMYDEYGQPYTPERAGEAQGTIAEGTEAGKGRQKVRGERIAVGTDAVAGIPTARRALDLLKRVETGGIDALSIGVKQRLGLENADEGELANIMGKAVLSQLKATFGAQFTEREGALLQRIEAGIGKSNAANRRILENLIKRAEFYAEQAMKDAAKMGDYETAAAIKKELSFEYGGEDDDAWLNGDVPPPPPGFEVMQ